MPVLPLQKWLVAQSVIDDKARLDSKVVLGKKGIVGSIIVVYPESEIDSRCVICAHDEIGERISTPNPTKRNDGRSNIRLIEVKLQRLKPELKAMAPFNPGDIIGNLIVEPLKDDCVPGIKDEIISHIHRK